MNLEFKYYFFGLVIGFLLLGMFILLLAALYSRKQQKNKTEKLSMHNQFQQSLLQAQIDTQEQTLKTISEEIHDNITQILSLAKLNLATITTGNFPPPDTEKMASASDLIKKAIADLRQLSRSLNAEAMSELGLPEAIQNELKILNSTAGHTTSFSTTGDVYKLPTQKEIVLFRIVQECMHNIIKHASAKNVSVNLLYQPSLFSLKVQDDGRGFNVADIRGSKSGIGLKNMRSRATVTGAEMQIDSSPGNGTTIIINLPVNFVQA